MPNEGDTKIVQFFAWVPVVIGFRVRWLCTVRVKYQLVFDAGAGIVGSAHIWEPIEFLSVEFR